MLIAIDFETYLTSEHERLPKPVCMAIVAEDGYETVVAGIPHMQEALRVLLDSPHVIVGHDAARFDFNVAAKWLNRAAVLNAFKARRLRCTVLWSKLADFAEGLNHSPYGDHYGDRQGYSLKAVCKRRWQIDIDKSDDTWRKRYSELDGVPIEAYPQAARKYVLDDARYGLALAKSLPDVPDVARKTEQFFWLAASSARGAYTDVGRAAEWRASLEQDMRDFSPHLMTAGILRPDGSVNDSAIRSRILSGAAGGDLATMARLLAGEGEIKRTPKGGISADKEACELSDDPLVQLYSLYQERRDKLSKEILTVETGLIHTYYDLAESGRTTSSGPPLQNIGVKSLARRCFKARSGLRYIVTDYSQLELSCIAHLCVVMNCGDNMARAIRAGQDLHTLLALQIDPNGDPKLIRRLAKEGNFGRNGGMGVNTLIKTARKRKVIITEETAKRIIAAHKKQWPEIAGWGGYHSKVKAELDRTGGLLSHYGSGRLRGGLSFTQGANTLFQGLGSEVMLDAFVTLCEIGLMPAFEVHDEFHHEVEQGARGDLDVKLIGDVCRGTGEHWLFHAPPKAEPKEVNDWSEAK